jgi:hypothetical protein
MMVTKSTAAHAALEARLASLISRFPRRGALAMLGRCEFCAPASRLTTA